MRELPRQLDELKRLKQWVCYILAYQDDKPKPKKVPIDPNSGKGAKANDPQTWGTYADAVAYAERSSCAGIGFQLASGYIGIDLDNVRDANTGELESFAADIVNLLDSYTEVSPSGTGLHILIKAELPPIGRRKGQLELYNNGRYLTVTGDVYGEPKPIAERTDAVKAVIAKYLAEQEPAARASSPQKPASGAASMSNQALWAKMFASKKGAEIRALYDGDISAYNNDHSRADQALMNYIICNVDGDGTRADELFRESALYRPKWDERRGALTYGERTIENALKGYRPYTPPQRPDAPSKAEQGETMEQQPQQPSEQANTENQSVHENQGLFDNTNQPDSVSDYIYSTFGEDLKRFQAFKDRKTGYSNLDGITSLYPGLYVVGAISSLGKTTFVHQMGDQIAATGEHVLYFSLEQSRLELATKGISRTMAEEAIYNGFEGAVSAIEIRRGYITDAVRKAAKRYSKQVKTGSVIECGFDTTIDSIVGYVNGYIKANGVKPVVIVDYLQIIRPSDPRQSTKDAVDSNVRALKMLQRNNDLVIIVICSLNRQNYLTPVDFESFKESGGIEYTADVVWGLQLACMNEDLFSRDKGIKEKRTRVKQAKLENPRKVELVCLKNRYGKSSYSCGFDYYPQYDFFYPEDDSIPVPDEGFPDFLEQQQF